MSRYVVTKPPIFLIFFFFFHMGFAQLSPTQMEIMKELYGLVNNNTNSSPWRNNSEDPCLWKGVSCNFNKSLVSNLSLSMLSLYSSEIMSVVCKIESLEFLDLSNNRFSRIPVEFVSKCGGLSELKVVNFSRNNLGGVLPVFEGFGVLEYLDLSHNKLVGNFDLQLNGLVKLKGLNLSHNAFGGSIPKSLGGLKFLEELELSMNGFVGNIPDEIANCGNLTWINLGGNMLNGSIPPRFGEFTKLDSLILSLNNLSGEIPQSLSRITTLKRFAANQNGFTGNIPLGMTRTLRNFDLSFNQLNGEIPIDLLSPLTLQTVDLSVNNLEGLIPANVSSSLLRLRLGSNELNGTIPRSFGNLQNLTYLELENNRMTGFIPSELGLCKSLALLNLAQNSLTGTLPVQLGNLTNLQVMRLQGNNIFGEIPIEITRLNELQRLDISWNSLNGSIPSTISGLQGLTNLDLQGNKLSGSIPDTIGSLGALLELQLGNNQLNGAIKSLPTNLQIALNLSSNKFDGPIPNSLSTLKVLEVLDLSNNRFSGDIPNFFTNMDSLTQLLLSNNQLSGVIPTFRPYVSVDAKGNKDLSNMTRTDPSLKLQKSKRTVSAGVVIAAAASVLAVAIIIVILVSMYRRYYRISDVSSHPGEDSPQTQVIRGSLLTPNGIHISNLDFATAMEAVSHPSNIVMKTRFSTYYKASMPSGKQYFVKKLNWSDKIFQVGSHVKFGKELETLGKLSNSNVMTPLAYVLTTDTAYLFYEYAEKGTLSDFLHSDSGTNLEWASRYSIALGVAQGLSFLHGYASGPILLLDLSSKSILLKSSREPQIGEIELYKVIDPTKSSSSFSTIAGSAGYIPPEYAYTMRVTMAANVYSFGVILLELLSGKPAVCEGTELAKWVVSKSMQPDKWDQILDFRVSETSPAVKSQMLAILRVALTCVSVSPEARPKMKSVLRMLLNAR